MHPVVMYTLMVIIYLAVMGYPLIEGSFTLRDYPIAMYVFVAFNVGYLLLFMLAIYGTKHLPFAVGKFLSLVTAPYCLYLFNADFCFAVVDIVRLINLATKFSSNDLRVFRLWWFIGSLIWMVVIYVISYINFQFIRIQSIDIEAANVPKQGRELKILLVSDLHLGYIIGKKKFQQWVSLMNAQTPGIILFPGDVSDNHYEPIVQQNLHEEFNRLISRYGVFVVPGNHEHHHKPPTIFEDYLKRTTRVHCLRDTSELVEDQFYIVGRDDMTNRNRKSIAELVDGLDRSKPIILMDHQPVGLKEAEDNGITLEVAGHTHSGQFFPVTVLVRR
jgi:predicted MPP superfamily phosphohydrolase